MLVLTVITCLTGCEHETAPACAQWVPYGSSQERYDAADAVFVGSHSEQVATTRLYGVEANTYNVQVYEVLKGNVSAEAIRVTSMPITCTDGDQYPEGDPLDTTERIIVFADKSDGKWFTLTPHDGTLPYSADTIDEITLDSASGPPNG